MNSLLAAAASNPARSGAGASGTLQSTDSFAVSATEVNLEDIALLCIPDEMHSNRLCDRRSVRCQSSLKLLATKAALHGGGSQK